jgi:hypothetical protein
VAKIFISYTAGDRKWADWIGVTLRDNGHVPFVHEWEIGAGGNIPRWMDERIKAADCLLAVFTDAYAGALYSSTERWAAYWNDPAGREGFLVPVEVEKVSDWPALTRPLKRLSLVGLSGVEAEIALLKFLEPAKPPAERPAFPGEPLKPSAGMLGGTGDGVAFTHLSAPLPAERPPLPAERPPLPPERPPLPTSHSILDIQPFIANDRSAVRYYFTFAVLVFSVGLAIVGVTFYPALKAENIIQDLAQKVGGGFISSLCTLPLKELLARRDRLRVLDALQTLIHKLRSQKTPPDEDVRRITELVWEIYKKRAIGS